VLCMNCNFAKGRFGSCPHQRKAQTGYEPFIFAAERGGSCA
jgi:hypothetical protein